MRDTKRDPARGRVAVNALVANVQVIPRTIE
jgi:hypothetical protein